MFNSNEDNIQWPTIILISIGFIAAISIIVIVACSCGSSDKTSYVTSMESVNTSAITTVTSSDSYGRTNIKTQLSVHSISYNDTTSPTTTEAPTTTATPSTDSIDYSQYEGRYAAFTGGVHCPIMDITDEGDYVDIYIEWGGGISGSSYWQMTARKIGNKLVYSDCIHTQYTYNVETGEKNTEVIYTNGSGYFEIDESSLKGTGTSEFSDLTFEKY